MQEHEVAVRPTLESYVTNLAEAFKANEPTELELIRHYDRKTVSQMNVNKGICTSLLILVGAWFVWFVLSPDQKLDWNVSTVMIFLLALASASIAYHLSTASFELDELRKNILNRWVIRAANQGKPVINDLHNAAVKHNRIYEVYLQEAQRLDTALQSKAFELAKTYPLADIPEKMLDFIHHDTTVHKYLKNCHTLAESLNNTKTSATV